MLTRILALAISLIGFSVSAESQNIKPLLNNYPPVIEFDEALKILSRDLDLVREEYAKLMRKGEEEVNKEFKKFGYHLVVVRGTFQNMMSRKNVLLNDAWLNKTSDDGTDKDLIKMYEVLKLNPDKVPMGKLVELDFVLGAAAAIDIPKIKTEEGANLYVIELLGRSHGVMGNILKAWERDKNENKDELQFLNQTMLAKLSIKQRGEDPVFDGYALTLHKPDWITEAVKMLKRTAQERGILTDKISERLDSISEEASSLRWTEIGGGVRLSNIKAFDGSAKKAMEVASELDPMAMIIPTLTKLSYSIMFLDIGESEGAELRTKGVKQTFADLDKHLNKFVLTPPTKGLFMKTPLTQDQVRMMELVKKVSLSHADGLEKNGPGEAEKNAQYRALIQKVVGY